MLLDSLWLNPTIWSSFASWAHDGAYVTQPTPEATEEPVTEPTLVEETTTEATGPKGKGALKKTDGNTGTDSTDGTTTDTTNPRAGKKK